MDGTRWQRRTSSAVRVALLGVCALLLMAPAAWADTATLTGVEAAAEALRDDPVYVDEQADPVPSDDEIARLREAISEAEAQTGDIFVAVLPPGELAEVGGDGRVLVGDLVEAVGERGTYVVAAGRSLRIGSSALGEGEGDVVAANAIEEAGGEGATVGAVLLATVPQIEQAVAGDLSGGGSGEGGDGGGGGGGGGGLLGFLALLVGGFGFFAWRRRRRQQAEERRQIEEIRPLALEDLVALDASIRELDNDTALHDPGAEVKRDQLTALESYSRASQGVDDARRPADFAAVTSAIEEGQYAVASARARLEGREPPERRPPCFFDPRHGPSVADAEWSPDGGAAREVPVCAADAARIADGEQPSGRQVLVDGQRRSYWDAPGYYGPWAGGYYGVGGGGFMGGLLLGSWFSGPFGFGGFGGFGGGYGGDGGGDSGGDGGDGGFDFGGGDFGGGGGDFGGGDF